VALLLRARPARTTLVSDILESGALLNVLCKTTTELTLQNFYHCGAGFCGQALQGVLSRGGLVDILKSQLNTQITIYNNYLAEFLRISAGGTCRVLSLEVH